MRGQRGLQISVGLATSAECGDELMIFRVKKTCLDNHARVDGEESRCHVSSVTAYRCLEGLASI